MKVRVTFDIRHWMVGLSFGDRYTTLLSIGPLNVWLHNAKKFKRDYENEILRNAGLM